MLCDTGVERVGRDALLALKKGKLLAWNDQMQETGFCTNRAIAIENLN